MHLNTAEDKIKPHIIARVYNIVTLNYFVNEIEYPRAHIIFRSVIIIFERYARRVYNTQRSPDPAFSRWGLTFN